MESKGLTSEEAAKRLEQFGRNELVRTTKVNPFKILLSQFSSPLIIILIVAAIISLAVGFFPEQQSDTIDAVLIIIIVILSGFFGFIQDYEAEKTIEALQKMASPRARVIRDGHETDIQSSNVVPGDLLLVESGDIVTADAKVLKAFHMELDESILTGESQTVFKNVDDDLYANTYVTGGNATLEVLQTGMRTRVGQVASRLQEIGKQMSPFQHELIQLGKKLSLLTLLIAVIIAAVGIFKFGFYNALMIAISLAVAAIPEGLPAVVVLALAAGAKMMVKKNAQIRKLSIIESVGAADIICTDKTGTLTKNEMTVLKLYYDDQEFDISAADQDYHFGPTGQKLLLCAILCNNSKCDKGLDGEAKYFGEQTEIALRQVGERFISHAQTKNFQKLNEISFSSQRKMMSVVMEDENDIKTVFSKGAPEILLEKCNRIERDGQITSLTEQMKTEILKENERLAKGALRVLGFAYKPTQDIENHLEKDLIWLGLHAMMDPPRPEVKQALADCKTAGIRVIMITGDNPITAGAIAEQVGLESQGTLLGDELDQMDEATLQDRLAHYTNIFARTNPFHKLKILEALQINHNVAMTGDGVNDALAIKKAEIGIAMGKKGTEVAKQASDIVLLDDNFSTIRDAIKEGRTIFGNIRKFINYLLTCNFAEVAVIFLATLFFDFKEPILFPVQLLWVNLLTDGLVALALGVDPTPKNIMTMPPRKRHDPIINKRLGWLVGAIGAKKTIILLATFFLVLPFGMPIARTVLFTGFVLYEFVRVGTIRYTEELNWFSNPWLLAAIAVSIGLQLMILYSPLNVFFKVVPLGITEWGILLGGCTVAYVIALPITKLVMRWVPE